MDEGELKRRTEAKEKLGWDECAATGAGHDFEEKPQSDGVFYCRYCGAEGLPEDQKFMASLA